jgi:hypothetical protein
VHYTNNSTQLPHSSTLLLFVTNLSVSQSSHCSSGTIGPLCINNRNSDVNPKSPRRYYVIYFHYVDYKDIKALSSSALQMLSSHFMTSSAFIYVTNILRNHHFCLITVQLKSFSKRKSRAGTFYSWRIIDAVSVQRARKRLYTMLHYNKTRSSRTIYSFTIKILMQDFQTMKATGKVAEGQNI